MHSNPRSLTQSINGLLVELVELFDACFPRFTHVRAAFHGIQVMWGDVKGNPPECIETRRINDRHIIGCAHANPSQVTSSRSAHVRLAITNGAVYCFKIASFAYGIAQDEGIATAGKKTISPSRPFLCWIELVGA